MAIDITKNVSYPIIRDDTPEANDFGIVSRVIGSIDVVFVPPDDTNINRIPASLAAVQLIAAGTVARKTVSIFNDSTAILFIKLGAAVTTNDFTTRVGPNELYETADPHYIGQITGLWTALNGGAQVTEEFTTP